MPLRGLNNKLRVHLATDGITYRKFYWFELDDQDLYWGSSADTKEAFCTITTKSKESFSIQTPKDFKELDLTRTKYSFHESGQFHLQRLEQGKYKGIGARELWERKDGLLAPKRIFSLITKPFFSYPEDNRKLTSKGYSSKAILLEGEAGNNRLFLEFFLTPQGQFVKPEPLFDFGADKQRYIAHGFSLNLILVLRFTKLAQLENWHPDKEVIFLEENSNKE